MPATRAATDAWPPRYLTTSRRRRTRGPEVGQFLEHYCRATKDTIASPAGQLLVLRPWQHRLLERLFAEQPDGRLQYRQAVVGMPRKNGKTGLAAGIGLHGLYLGPAGAEVYSCAGDKDQARLAFGAAKRMVELDPELSQITTPYRDALEVTETGSVYRVVSSDAPLKEGLSPTLVVFDELHVQPDDDLWSVMNLGSGARAEALILAITTAGKKTWTNGQPSLCYRMYEYGRAVAKGDIVDDRFFFAWWEPAHGLDADWSDPAVWEEANPGFDDIVAADDFGMVLPPKIPVHEFRTKRTNVFVDAVVEGWLDDAPGAYAACESDLELPETGGVMTWDMSLRHDCTSVGTYAKVDGRVVSRVKIFRKDEALGKVDFVAVRKYVREEAARRKIRTIGYDPRLLEFEAQEMLDADLPMEEFPQSIERMSPACQLYRELIVSGGFAHDGDGEHMEHVLGAVKRVHERGFTLSKARSGRPIDACICDVMGVALLEGEDEFPPADIS